MHRSTEVGIGLFRNTLRVDAFSVDLIKGNLFHAVYAANVGVYLFASPATAGKLVLSGNTYSAIVSRQHAIFKRAHSEQLSRVELNLMRYP